MWSGCNYIWKSIRRLFGVNEQSFVYRTVVTQTARLKDGQTAIVRIATVADLDAIFHVEQDAYAGRAPWDRRALSVDLHYNERAVYFVCEVEQAVVGFVGARFVDEREVHITNVAVAIVHQTKGVAQTLLKRLENFVSCNQRNIISLEVRESNGRAQTLYRLLGYQQTGVKEQYYYPDGEDAIEMRKVVKELITSE